MPCEAVRYYKLNKYPCGPSAKVARWTTRDICGHNYSFCHHMAFTQCVISIRCRLRAAVTQLTRLEFGHGDITMFKSQHDISPAALKVRAGGNNPPDRVPSPEGFEVHVAGGLLKGEVLFLWAAPGGHDGLAGAAFDLRHLHVDEAGHPVVHLCGVQSQREQGRAGVAL
eukprot:scaffold119873_cov47-Prasinocladus_malaysianus.AAC.1